MITKPVSIYKNVDLIKCLILYSLTHFSLNDMTQDKLVFLVYESATSLTIQI